VRTKTSAGSWADSQDIRVLDSAVGRRRMPSHAPGRITHLRHSDGSFEGYRYAASGGLMLAGEVSEGSGAGFAQAA